MDLLKRSISAVFLIALLVSVLLLGGWYLVAATILINFFMTLDVTHALKAGGYSVNRIVLLTTALLAAPALYFFGILGYFMLTAVAMCILAACVVLSKTPNFKAFAAGVFTLVYPLLPGALMITVALQCVARGDSLGALLLGAACIYACIADTFAYAGGRLFGKRKLCPAISPKKTVAGCIASFVGGAAAGVLLYFMALHWAKTAEIALVHWLIMGVACGGFAQIGDLIASMLKRFCGVKDFGAYIPGHGGIMDRMDSIMICAVAVLVYVQIFAMDIL